MFPHKQEYSPGKEGEESLNKGRKHEMVWFAQVIMNSSMQLLHGIQKKNIARDETGETGAKLNSSP